MMWIMLPIPHVLKLNLRDELADGLLQALVLAGPDPVLGPHQQGAVQLALSGTENGNSEN